MKQVLSTITLKFKIKIYYVREEGVLSPSPPLPLFWVRFPYFFLLQFWFSAYTHKTFRIRARLSQKWALGLMCTWVLFLNRPKNLNIFDELKYIMWRYTSVLVGMYHSRLFILPWRKYFFLQFLPLSYA